MVAHNVNAGRGTAIEGVRPCISDSPLCETTCADSQMSPPAVVGYEARSDPSVVRLSNAQSGPDCLQNLSVFLADAHCTERKPVGCDQDGGTRHNDEHRV